MCFNRNSYAIPSCCISISKLLMSGLLSLFHLNSRRLYTRELWKNYMLIFTLISIVYNLNSYSHYSFIEQFTAQTESNTGMCCVMLPFSYLGRSEELLKNLALKVNDEKTAKLDLTSFLALCLKWPNIPMTYSSLWINICRCQILRTELFLNLGIVCTAQMRWKPYDGMKILVVIYSVNQNTLCSKPLIKD